MPIQHRDNFVRQINVDVTMQARILVPLQYIGLVDMAIFTNPKPTVYRNLYQNTGPSNDIVSNSKTII